MDNTGANIFTIGGTVQAGSGLYIARKVDEELLQLCRDHLFAHVLTARQMGKSSLMIRTAARLADEGTRSAIIDLSQMGVQITDEAWYFGLI
ncbi:MAG: AAA-like domain-containing protein, partial [Bacteroidetes bacterium]|nr:AAA-like domain-containing protein [Bacteroidota bacterium]